MTVRNHPGDPSVVELLWIDLRDGGIQQREGVHDGHRDGARDPEVASVSALVGQDALILRVK